MGCLAVHRAPNNLGERVFRRFEFDATDPERRGSCDIVVFIADHEAAAAIDRTIARRLLQQAGFRLPASADDGEFRYGALRVMRTVIECVDARPPLPKSRAHGPLQLLTP